MKNILIIGAAFIVIGIVAFFFMRGSTTTVENPPQENTPSVVTPEKEVPTTAPSPVTEEVKQEPVEIIGSSYGERPIKAFHFGSGAKEVLFVGGIHGGYEWNTSLVAYELIDYLTKNPTAVPKNVKVTVIPVLNPDGLAKVAGKTESFTKADIPTGLNATVPGRFNDNNVDLNRNFDCEWKATGTWQNKTVSGGTKAFSEPESQAFRDYVNGAKPVAVVVWYSSAESVYSSNCNNGTLPETAALTNLYAKASGYPAHESFDDYELTGDAVNWLASVNVPGISVLLTNHEDTEWEKNLKGIKAVLLRYAE